MSSKRFKVLLSLAAAQLFEHARICFEKRVDHDQRILQRELNVQSKINDQEAFKNDLRDHTTAFQFSRNGYCYISLNFQAFQYFVCSWLGSVHDYYILYSRPVRDQFVRLVANSPLKLIKDSDRDEESQAENEVLISIRQGFQASG